MACGIGQMRGATGLSLAIGTLMLGWKEILMKDGEVYGPLAVYQRVVYIHTQDLTLHRVNAENGAVLRPISLESPD